MIEEVSKELDLFNNLDIDKLCEKIAGFIEKKIKDHELSDTKWLDNKKAVDRKIYDVVHNILLDMEKHLNVKEELPLFNDSDIEKLCEQFIEYIEKKVKYREEWFENKEIIKKKVWDVIHNILLDIEKYLDSEEMSEGLVLFNN